jgi:hypothetical protein
MQQPGVYYPAQPPYNPGQGQQGMYYPDFNQQQQSGLHY